MDKIILKAENIRKSFPQGQGELEILKGVILSVYEGEALGIQGASGAGKSTLLQILGTLDQPTSGTLFYKEQNLLAMNDEAISKFRNETMGFVFQFHHLVSELSAIENVMMPLLIAGEAESAAKKTASEFLASLGVGHREGHFPNQLSGGELQRVAIARALVKKPQILFADEPTGNLDSANSLIIQDLFFDLKKQFGLTLVVISHDPLFMQRFPRRLKMRDGNWES